MAIFKKKQDLSIDNIVLPNHVGIIMDGNGRWARKRGLPRSAGHSAGAKNFRKIIRYCSDIGIKHLTMYAFSTENWKRPDDEVQALMKLFKQYLEEALRDFQEDTIKLKFIGDIKGFSPEIQSLMIDAQEGSKDRDGMVLNLAMTVYHHADLRYPDRSAGGPIWFRHCRLDEYVLLKAVPEKSGTAFLFCSLHNVTK